MYCAINEHSVVGSLLKKTMQHALQETKNNRAKDQLVSYDINQTRMAIDKKLFAEAASIRKPQKTNRKLPG